MKNSTILSAEENTNQKDHSLPLYKQPIWVCSNKTTLFILRPTIIYSFLMVLVTCSNAFAQLPRDVPQPDGEPLALDSTRGLIVFVVLPVLLLLLYFFLRMRRKRKK